MGAGCVLSKGRSGSPEYYILRRSSLRVCDSLRVGSDAVLTLAAGARLYFNDRASLLVDGTLRAEGTPEARVLLQHVRNDDGHENAPGQWQGLFFGRKSKR